MTCKCSSKRIGCLHRHVVKWYLFQEQRDVLAQPSCGQISEPDSVSDEDSATIAVDTFSPHLSNISYQKMMDYIATKKKYPGEFQNYQPIDTFFTESVTISPVETFCFTANQHFRLPNDYLHEVKL